MTVLAVCPCAWSYPTVEGECSSFSDLGLPLVHPEVRVYVLAVAAMGHFTHNWLLLYGNFGVQVLMPPLPWVNNFQNDLDMHVDFRALQKFAT